MSWPAPCSPPWAKRSAGFVVENRAGGAGSLGAELAARAAPDGYTLLAGSGGSLTANPVLQANLSYDPLRDFAPIGLLARVPNVLILAPRMTQRSGRNCWPLPRPRRAA